MRCLAILLLLLTAPQALPARAAVLYHGAELLAPGVTTALCVERGTLVMRSIGLTIARTADNAVWGEMPGSGRLFSLLCFGDRGVVVVMAALNDRDDAQNVMLALIQGVRRMIGADAPAAVPPPVPTPPAAPPPFQLPQLPPLR